MTTFPRATPITLAPRTTRDGARTPEITLSVHEAGSGPAVVLCHGFPELAYSWRHQLGALAEAGFRAIAPDQRGYGASDRPEAIAEYDIHHLCGDMVGLLDLTDPLGDGTTVAGWEGATARDADAEPRRSRQQRARDLGASA